MAAIKKKIAVKQVHNLTVDDIHTYHVLIGAVATLVHNCGPDDLVYVYRAPQKGNGTDELANGLNPARHATGDRSEYIGTEDVAKKWADYSVGTHENGYIRFSLRREDLEKFGRGFPYEGGPGREWVVPRDKIDLSIG